MAKFIIHKLWNKNNAEAAKFRSSGEFDFENKLEPKAKRDAATVTEHAGIGEEEEEGRRRGRPWVCCSPA